MTINEDYFFANRQFNMTDCSSSYKGIFIGEFKREERRELAPSCPPFTNLQL
jgi:hypothetical protein